MTAAGKAHSEATRPDSSQLLGLEPGLTFSQAQAEAWRCLQCFDAPCTKACPAGIVIPRFIRMIRSGNLRGAAEVVRSSNPLASSCGVACPDEQLCGAACLRGELDRPIQIRRLHRFATDAEESIKPRAPMLRPAASVRVAVVGAGPAGLACASELRRMGAEVVLFERRDRIGGVLSSTIPLYRFPETAVAADGRWALGPTQGTAAEGSRVTLKLSTPVPNVPALSRKFDAVFLAPGLGLHGRELEGADLRGVSTADAFLERCRQSRYKNPIGSEVVIIGGGNVAIDAAMAVVRCGSGRGGSRPRVHLLYRRTRGQMPAWEREVREAEEVGVILHFLVIPEALLGRGGRLTGIRLTRASLGPEDASGRPVPVPVAGSQFILPCDQAVLAMGMQLDREALPGLSVSGAGRLRVQGKTLRVQGTLFAGGDAVSMEQTIVAAVRDGKRAARAMAEALGLGGE